MAIPSWLATFVSSGRRLPLNKLGEYIGTRIPAGLGPPIGVCEVIRSVIRPLTLGLRLAANIVAGHIITSLVLNTFIFLLKSGGFGVFFLLFVSVGLYLFELAICFIQAYVFVLLLGIYVQEYPIRG